MKKKQITQPVLAESFGAYAVWLRATDHLQAGSYDTRDDGSPALFWSRKDAEAFKHELAKRGYSGEVVKVVVTIKSESEDAA